METVVLQYDTPIRNKSLSKESFKVEGKDVTRIYANNAPERAEKGKDGQYVIIEVKAEVDLNARPQMPSEADKKKKEERDRMQGGPGLRAGWSAEEIATAELATSTPDSLQQETAEGLTLESTLGTEAPEEALVEKIALREAIRALPERDQENIFLRFFKCMTQEQAARILGVSQVQVSRLERKGVAHLREMLRD